MYSLPSHAAPASILWQLPGGMSSFAMPDSIMHNSLFATWKYIHFVNIKCIVGHAPWQLPWSNTHTWRQPADFGYLIPRIASSAPEIVNSRNSWAYFLTEGFVSLAFWYSSSVRERKPLYSSIKSDTIIRAPCSLVSSCVYLSVPTAVTDFHSTETYSHHERRLPSLTFFPGLVDR